MSFSYNNSVPFSTNNPSNDQPQMLINTQSINSIIGVDHVSFNASSGGTHLQATFSSKNTPGAQTDPQSVVYTGNGTASTNAQLFYVNQNATFHLSPIKAWAIADNNGNVIASQSSNCSVSRTSKGQFSITISTGATSSANYGVIVSSGNQFNVNPAVGMLANYVIVNQTSFNLEFIETVHQGFQDPAYFSFMVLQI